MAVRIVGCDPIIGVDPLPSRLALARELGTTCEDLGEIFASLR
jgi:threonine dehydrogenase-like Zn-dependent dehydrogenase